MLYRSIFSIFFLFSLFTIYLSNSELDLYNIIDQYHFTFSELHPSDECRDCEDCNIGQCSCPSLFSETVSSFSIVNIVANQQKTKYNFGLFYKSQSIMPKLRPPRIS